jgi:hypothetical protein
MFQFTKVDCPIFALPDTDPAFSVFSQEDIEGGHGMRMCLTSLIPLPLSSFRTFGHDQTQLPFLTSDDILPFGLLGLIRSNHDLLPFKPNHVHVGRELIFVELHLGYFSKFQPSLICGQLNLMTESITIISNTRIRIMPFTICILF